MPKEARAYLRANAGKGRRAHVIMFHRWMNDNDLTFGHLTPAHIEHFWEKQRNLKSSTLHTRRCHQHRYLYWLYERGHLRFVVEPSRLRHMRRPLPEPARRFLDLPGRRRHEPGVRNLHDWMTRKHIDLDELTPAHLEAFSRRPIDRPISKTSREDRLRRLEPYVLWLYEQGLMRFRAKRRVRKAFELPQRAMDYVDTLRPVRKPATCTGYIVDLRNLHAWLSAHNLSVDDLDRQDTERWLTSLADRGLAPITRNYRILHARSYFWWLVEQGDFDKDPDDLLRVADLPKIPSYLPRPYPPDADRRLQERLARSGDTLCRALLLMRRTGLRIGELVNLERRCLEYDHCGNTFLKVPLGKLDNERLVPLDEKSKALAQDLLEQSTQGNEFLIEQNLGRETLKAKLRIALKATAEGLDIPSPITTHRLRHSYATELLNAGMSFVGIMKLLGHHSFKMTMRYAAITQETVVKDYYAALKISEETYAIENRPSTSQHPNPEQMLTDTISWLRKNHTSTAVHKHRADAIIKRIYKIREDIKIISNQT
ncbi:MAG: tyrosine-type recombinase/integrase [bacterium]